MLFSGKWLDPVIGIDIHLIQPPGPVPPIPVPHPFIGIVYDPAGLLVGMAISAAMSGVFGGSFSGPVLINGMPAANTGTQVKGMPIHIPIGGAFVNPPSNEGTIITGSKTVHVMGTSGARLTSMVITCNDPVNLPTSVVMSIPMGAPVYTGGPTAVDWLAVALSAIRTKWVSDKLHDLFKAKPGSWRSKIICFLTGHPVDVATGRVLTDHADFQLPGPIPFRFERAYYSASTYEGPLGHGWHHTYDQQITFRDDATLLRMFDGRTVELDPVAPGGSVYEPVERLRVDRHRNAAIVHTHDHTQLRFGPVTETDGDYRLVSIEDGNENRIVLNYAEGMLTSINDSTGRHIRLVNDRRGRLLAIVAPHPEDNSSELTVTRFEYDDLGDLITVYDGSNQPFRYAYKNHLLIRETDRTGLTFYFEYDAYSPDAKCIHTFGDGNIYERLISYDSAAHVTIVETPAGGKTVYFWNDDSLVTEIVDPLGSKRVLEWDANCRKVAETAPNGGRTQWEYDSIGNLTKYTDPLGNTVELQYNKGHISQTRDERGYKWSRSVDERGNLVAAEDPLGNTWRTAYDRFGRIQRVIDPLGAVLELEYDSHGNVIGERDWEGNLFRFQRDGWGRCVRSLNPLGETMSFVYDLLGRVTKVTRSDGSVFLHEYDSEGRLISSRSPLGGVDRYRYEGRGWLAAHTDRAGKTVRYRYDGEGRLLAVENDDGVVRTLERDLVGRVTKETTAGGRITRYTYDAAGDQASVTSGTGRPVRFQYDLLGRMIGMNSDDGYEATFVYDQAHNITEAQNADAKVTLEYDAVGQIVKESVGDDFVESAYDRVGRRIVRRTSIGSETLFSYDRNGALVGLVAGKGNRVTFKRDGLGREIERHVGTGLVLRHDYDAGRRLRRQRLKGPFGPDDALRRECSYDELGNVIEIRDTKWGIVSLAFDDRCQVVSANRTSGVSEHFSYDGAGNITKWVETAPVASGVRRVELDSAEVWGEYDADGRLLRKGQIVFTYDDAGRVVRKEELGKTGTMATKWEYRWQDDGQLRGVRNGRGESWVFKYDAFGRRLVKLGPGASQRFVWDGGQVAHEVDERGHWAEWFFHPNSWVPVGVVQEAQFCTCVTDHIGSLTEIVRTDGTVLMSRQATTWGGSIDTDPVGVRCPIGFQGQWIDEDVELHWNLFRYYDPSCGRYLSPDPMGLLGGDHAYRYVPGGNPTNLIDPLGLLPWAWNPTDGMGHHLVPRGKAASAGLPHLASERMAPTFFPIPYSPGMHEAIHAAQRPHIGPIQGPWTGTVDELFAKSRAGLADMNHLRGELRIPGTGEVLARNVTPTEAFDELMKWDKQKRGLTGCG